jgi:pimeloyl-ACP methyl ester carboxylesterase
MGLRPAELEDALFRLTRLSFRAVSLAEQSHAIAAITDRRGYADGQSVLAGISYGGLIAARAGAIYPGRFKALALFSPGVENPGHVDRMRGLSALLEGSPAQRRLIRGLVREVANSPRYDAYVPEILKEHDQAFRDSLQSKMLGELDMDLRADLARIRDRVYLVSGGRDQAIDARRQIDAMRVVFVRSPLRGAFILIPEGGHALWGNPEQSAERAVIRCLEEIRKGPSETLRDGGVYAWNEQTGALDLLGMGLHGLDLAESMVEALKR